MEEQNSQKVSLRFDADRIRRLLWALVNEKPVGAVSFEDATRLAYSVLYSLHSPWSQCEPQTIEIQPATGVATPQTADIVLMKTGEGQDVYAFGFWVDNVFRPVFAVNQPEAVGVVVHRWLLAYGALKDNQRATTQAALDEAIQIIGGKIQTGDIPGHQGNG